MIVTEDQAQFFDRNGYILVRDVIPKNLLPALRAAADDVEEETRADWLSRKDDPDRRKSYGYGPSAHVIEPVIDRNDIFVDVLECPGTVEFAERFIGPDMMMIDNAYHVKIPGTEAHTRWHRDAKIWDFDVTNWSKEDRSTWNKMRMCKTPHYKIKVFVFVDDVDEETGPFSVVPGTHLEDAPPPQWDNLEAMPDQVKLTGPAGSAVIWNGRIWHTATHNTDTKARRMLLYNYTHFGEKQYDECIPRGDFRERMIRERSPTCLQLLGIKRLDRA